MAQQRNENIPTNPITERIQEFENHDSILIDGNPLFPNGYLPQIERQIEDKLRESGIPVNEAMSQIGMLMHQTLHAQVGHRVALEQLAEEVVIEMYGPLLENVDLDIQLALPGEPAQQMAEPAEPPPMEEIEEEEIRNEIYKRRVSNYLTSGAAISSHRIIHMPDYRDRLNRISPDLVEKYDQLLKLNEILDGAIPIEDQERMWREQPEGMAGSVKVEWPQDENDAEEIVQVEDEEAVQFEDGNEELDMPQAEEERDVVEGHNPIIHARGIDFPMLVHETIKGVYELIMANGIPEEEDLARQVIDNADTYMQELIGHRVGPQLRQDILEYINQHEASNDFPNLLEYVLGRLITLPATEFLILTNGILNGSITSKEYIDELIHQIVEELRDYNIYKIEQDQIDNDPFSANKEDVEEIEKVEEVESKVTKVESTTETEFDTLSKIELQAEMDKALDKEDWDTAREIGKHLEKFL